MKRLIILIITLLLLGVITSYAVSACLIRDPSVTNNLIIDRVETHGFVNGRWLVGHSADALGTNRTLLMQTDEARSFHSFSASMSSTVQPLPLPGPELPSYSMAMNPPQTSANGEVFGGIECEHGWPMRCARASYVIENPSLLLPEQSLQGGIRVDHVRWGVTLPAGLGWKQVALSEDRYRVLPLTPIVRGLATNTLVYAFLWALILVVLFIPSRLRCYRRLAKGRCFKCAYDLAGIPSDRCPECGSTRATRIHPIHLALVVSSVVMLVIVSLIVVGFVFSVKIPDSGVPPIHRAATNGNLAVLQRELDRGTDVDLRYTYDLPLQVRVQNGSIVCEYPQFDLTPLMRAAVHNQTDAMSQLLDAGADVNTTVLYNSVLTLAARNGHRDACELLLAHGADLRLNPGEAYIPYCQAHRNGHIELAAFLRESGPRDVRVTQAVLNVASEGPKDEFLAVVDQYIWSDSEIERALRNACTHGNLPVVDAILAMLTDVSFGMLAHAVLCKDIKVLERLMENDSDIETHLSELLFYASHRAQSDRITFLIERGADPNAPNTRNPVYPLLVAMVRMNADEYVRSLLDAGADPRVPEETNRGLFLRLRFLREHPEFYDVFVEHGVNINTRDSQGRTPIVRAVESTDAPPEQVARLLELGADPWIEDSVGESAIDRLKRIEKQRTSDPALQGKIKLFKDVLGDEWDRHEPADIEP